MPQPPVAHSVCPQFQGFPLRMRPVITLLLCLPLAACARGWDADAPFSAPGGTGLMADDTLAEGPGAVSSVSQLPAYNKAGVVAPYGAQGTTLSAADVVDEASLLAVRATKRELKART